MESKKRAGPEAGASQGKKTRTSDWNEIVQVKVSDLLVGKKGLILVRNTDTVKDTLHTLAENNILGAPVIDSSSGRFLGFVDTIDIVGYTISLWRHNAAAFDREAFHSDDFFLRPISRVLNFSRVDEPVVLTEDDSLKDVIQTFCNPEYHRRLHRVAIVRKGETSHKLVNLLSQTDILRFFREHLDSVPRPSPSSGQDVTPQASLPFADSPVGSLGVIHSTIMAFLDSSLIDTLEILYKNRVSGLALVDSQFRISGNLSASDLRGMKPDAFKYFTRSTLQFLVKGTDAKLHPPVTVTPANTLREVLDKLITNKVHRVYVTNEDGHISGLISQRDLLPLLCT